MDCDAPQRIMDEHIKYLESQIQSKLNSLPRAIQGNSPMERLKEISEEIRIIKEIKEIILKN